MKAVKCSMVNKSQKRFDYYERRIINHLDRHAKSDAEKNSKPLSKVGVATDGARTWKF